VAATRNSRAQTRAAVVAFPGTRGRRVRLGAVLPSARSLAAGICLVALALGAYAAARSTSVFAIREVRVEGATPALARDVRAVLAPLAGESLLALDRGALVERLEAIPAVRSATYDRAFPHTLVVSVERELAAAVLRRGAESWLVSTRGRILGRVGRGAHPRLARVWVPKDVHVAPGVLVAAPDALRGVRAAAVTARAAFPARVRTIRTGGGELTFLLGSGVELRLGDDRDLELKLAVAAQILPTLPPPATGGPQYLDVGVPERPVAGRNPQVEGRG